MEKILSYWFEHALSNAVLARQPDMNASFDRWFKGKEDDLQQAIWDNSFKRADDWPDTAKGQIARVILYDQIPRGCFRGTPQAFVYDVQATFWADRFLNASYPSPMSLSSPICLSYLFMILVSLSHSEQLDVQVRSLNLSAQFAQEVSQLTWLSPKTRQQLAQVHSEAQQHYDVVRAFGRFPHRNRVLGRESTPEEKQFLQQSQLPNWMKSQSIKGTHNNGTDALPTEPKPGKS